jgi:hypothetical protein
MPETLLAATGANDLPVTLEVLEALDEASRRAAAPTLWRAWKEFEGLPYVSGRGEALRAALVGCASPGELQKLRFRVVSYDEVAVRRALATRPPSVRQAIADGMVRDAPARWNMVLGWADAGLVARPEGDPWILGMIGGLTGRRRPIRDALLDRPDLQPEVWRLFELEGDGEHSLAAYDKYVREGHGWDAGIAALPLDRGRLIDACLDALARDFAPFRAGWFTRFHQRLAPTRAERSARFERYVRLLHSPVGPTVALAVEALEGCDGGDPSVLLSALRSAAVAAAKKTAKAALALAARFAELAPDSVVAVALDATTHSDADVQATAVALLTRLGAVDRVDVSVLAPTVRARLGVLPPRPAPVTLVPEAPPAAGLTPLSTVEELVFALSAALEDASSLVQAEQVLEAVARLATVDPGAFADPLRVRARARLRSANEAERWVAHLALAWLDRAAPKEPAVSGPAAIFDERWREVAARVAAREVLPLRSFPTEPSGRIDPAVYAARTPSVGADQAIAERRANPPAATVTLEVGRSGDTWHFPKAVLSTEDPVVHRAFFQKTNTFNPTWSKLSIRQLCSLHPPEVAFAMGAQFIGGNADWWEARWSDVAWIERLLDPTTEWGPSAVALAVFGLGCKESGQRMLAVDAVSAALTHGRLSSGALGEGLARWIWSAVGRPGRLGPALAAIAEHSPAHAGMIQQALQGALPAPAGAKDVHAIVSPLAELSTLLGVGISNPALRAWLGGLPASSKAGRAARTLLALPARLPPDVAVTVTVAD